MRPNAWLRLCYLELRRFAARSDVAIMEFDTA
jgi:hypothetical protein